MQEALRNSVSDKEIVELEKELIKIPSYTTEETELAEFIVDYLHAESIDARLQEVPIPEFAQTKSDRTVTHNVIGKIEGNGEGTSLMFNGHMDHGPWDIRQRAETPFDEWEREPYEPVEGDERIYGKGSADEKGGICAMLATAVALIRAEIDLQGDVYFCPVAGHKSHSFGTKYMMETGLYADYGINTETAGNWIVPTHIGVVTAEVHISGVNPRRRYDLPETMDKATGFMNAYRFIQALGKEGVPHPKDGWSSFQPHPVLTEWPSHIVLHVDKESFEHIVIGLKLNTVPGMDSESYKRDLERVLNQLQNQHDDFGYWDLDVKEWGPPLNTLYTSPIVESLATSYENTTGEKARVGIEGRFGNYGDGSILDEFGIETCTFGPGQIHNSHEIRQVKKGEIPPDEYINKNELVDSARTMALTAARICG